MDAKETNRYTRRKFLGLLVFDDGVFSEFTTFLLTDWPAHTPPEVVAKNSQAPSRPSRNSAEGSCLSFRITTAALPHYWLSFCQRVMRGSSATNWPIFANAALKAGVCRCASKSALLAQFS